MFCFSRVALAVLMLCLPVARPRFVEPLQTPRPLSLLEKSTLFTVYGRAFDTAPVLGRLGSYKGIDEMAKDIKPWVAEIKKCSRNKGVVPGIHLIYAMAIPCKPKDDCLLYLEGREKHIVENYIQPAAARGWAVVLDTQLGKSTPVEQVKRMIDKGYLKYDNVHVAIDPEFHVYNNNLLPGIPIGTVPAYQINRVQKMLDQYVRDQKLRTKKVLIVHQFGDPAVRDGVPNMIQNKISLDICENVDLVIDMDGLGKRAVKVNKYNKITDPKLYPFIHFRGIKVFFPNKWEHRGHYDRPPLTFEEIFGLKKVPGNGIIKYKPNVVIIA